MSQTSPPASDDRPRLPRVLGEDRGYWRVLPRGYRDDMFLVLKEAGWSAREIAAFTSLNIHRTTVGRAMSRMLCSSPGG